MNRQDLVDFLHIPLKEKIELAASLLEEVFTTNNIIYILDQYCIVSQDGSIVDWYMDLIDILKNKTDKTALFIISKVVPFYKLLQRKDYIFSIHVPGLEKTECNSLFQALLDIDNIDLLSEDKKIISNLFTGFPTQIIYTVDYLKNVGIARLKDNLNIIADYNSEQVSSSVQKYENDDEAMNLLKILSDYDIISLRLLEKIYGSITESTKDLILDFSNSSLIEYVGATKEYMKLNDGIRDYIQRLNLRLDEKYSDAIKRHSLQILKEYSKNFESDFTELTVSIQTALVNNNYDEIPKELLIPSFYLNAMNELYRKRAFDLVEELARKLLQNSDNLDKKIIREIRYWLCSALAKKRDPKFLEEVQYLSGNDHNFLVGFYYRLCRRYDDALKRLTSLLEDYPNHNRGKRELVIVYTNLEDYDSAFEIARECYLANKNNPYHIHAYFRCLIKKESSGSSKNDDLGKLLHQLKSIPSVKADEMYFSLKAEYEAFIQRNIPKAYATIDEGISKYPDNVYPYITKLEIAKKIHDKDNLNAVINTLNRHFSSSELNYRLNYLSACVMSHCLDNDFHEAEKIVKTKIKNKYPKRILKSLEEEIKNFKKNRKFR